MVSDPDYTLTDREVRFMRQVADKRQTVLCLPKTRFLHGLEMSSADIMKTDMRFFIRELQQKVAEIDPRVILGWNVKKDYLCWYTVPKGGKPKTQVPFYYNIPEWEQIARLPEESNPVAEVRNAWQTNYREILHEQERLEAGGQPRTPKYVSLTPPTHHGRKIKKDELYGILGAPPKE